ncbi:hypothetical protein [Paraburkholderia sp. MM6662-R1]|uniref:hypothetical protein n=1 Tax=Paraburkholderia sp. MM6662-R1 TaxID=2991066 RepID=UPI003D1A6B2B
MATTGQLEGFDTDQRFGGSGLHIALQRASGTKPYLGDSQVVGAFTRGFLAGICERAAAVGEHSMDREDAMRADRGACHDAAAVFLDQNPAYESVGQWNSGGGMVDWMLRALDHVYDAPASEQDRERIVADVFAWAARFAYEAISAHQDDGDETGLQDDLENLADDLARFLLGVPGRFEKRLFE